MADSSTLPYWIWFGCLAAGCAVLYFSSKSASENAGGATNEGGRVRESECGRRPSLVVSRLTHFAARRRLQALPEPVPRRVPAHDDGRLAAGALQLRASATPHARAKVSSMYNIFFPQTQGPYVYALYDAYGFSKGQIGILFIAGFGSSLVFGTVVGGFADRFGRKANCLLFAVLYSVSCMTKHFNDFNALLFGRLTGGISTSILYSAFETWMIHEHKAAGGCPSISARPRRGWLTPPTSPPCRLRRLPHLRHLQQHDLRLRHRRHRCWPHRLRPD